MPEKKYQSQLTAIQMAFMRNNRVLQGIVILDTRKMATTKKTVFLLLFAGELNQNHIISCLIRVHFVISFGHTQQKCVHVNV